MITNDGYKRLFHFLLWCIVGFIIAIVGISNVFAYSYTTIGDQSNITTVLVSTAYGSQPFTVPKNATYNFYEVLQIDYLINNYNFDANKHYQLESHLSNQTLTNANKYIVTGLNGEQCYTDYTASIFTGAYPRWDFQCPHATSSITLTISNNANQYLWNNSGIFTWTSALLSYSSESIPVSSDTQDIINSQTQNTQNIINNQNQNTQDIINNQNQNTQQIIENNKSCDNVSKADEEFIGYLYNNGQIGTNDTSSIVTKYFSVNENSTITKIDPPLMDGPAYRICFYDEYKTFISCLVRQDYYNVDTIPIPDNASYVRFTINISDDVPKFKICKNGNQALNDTLNDDKVDSDKIGSAFSDFNDFLDNNSTITQLIVLPITLYTAILNNLNGTCTPFNLGTLFEHNLTLPCINISQYLGNTLWTMIDIIVSGFAIYSISRKMIKVFNSFTFMKDGDVLDD